MAYWRNDMHFFKRSVAAIIFVLVPLAGFSQKTIPLPDLIKPDSIVMDSRHIYITDEGNIYIYGKSFTLEKKFGRRGEGPGEFKINPAGVVKLQIFLRPGEILVNNLGRVSFFTKEGTYKNQLDVTSGRNFVPLGKGYAGYTGDKVIKNTLYLSINLYDGNFKKIKEIYNREYYVQTHKDFDLTRLGSGNKGRAYYLSHGNKLFIQGEGDTICVFDDKGNKAYDIPLEHDKLEISKAQEENILKDLHTLFTGRAMRRLIEEKGKFPKRFPARFFQVDNGKIYLPTFKKKGGKNEFVIYDIKGKFLKKLFLPFQDQTLLLPYPYTIYADTLYQLFDNEDTETWEVHITKIE